MHLMCKPAEVYYTSIVLLAERELCCCQKVLQQPSYCASVHTVYVFDSPAT